MAKNTKKIPTQSEDIDNIIRYLKNPNNSNSYEQYLRPIIKKKGQQYVDKLLGSTILVLKENELSLNNIEFDENEKMTIVKE